MADRLIITGPPSKAWVPRGLRLKRLRKLAGLTLEEVAAKVKFERVLLLAAENGRRSLYPQAEELVEEVLLQVIAEHWEEAQELLA